jgi:hypothetical protein
MDEAEDAFGGDDEEQEDNIEGNANRNLSAAEPAAADGYSEFRSRQARGTLYKLDAMPDDVHKIMHKYVHEGYMEKDLRFAREVFGLTNTSGRKEFTTYWESPWVEEHIRDTTKRRKVEAQERAMAARTFIRNSSANESDNVRKFIETVETLRKWEDNSDSRDNVKTISRLIQSFERVAVRNMITNARSAEGEILGHDTRVFAQHFKRIQTESSIQDISSIAHTLRRSDHVFDMFALLVAAEISVADLKSGTRNISISLANSILDKRKGAEDSILERIAELTVAQLTTDKVGLPLMTVPYNLCVSRGVLLVGEDTKTSYVLDIDGCLDKFGKMDLTGVKTIVITSDFSGKSVARAAEPGASESSAADSREPLAGGGSGSSLIGS